MQNQLGIKQRLDLIGLLCLAVIAIGWFGMNSVVITFGRLTQGTRFYQLGVLLTHPAALFFGVGSSDGLALAISLLVSIAVLVWPAAAAVLCPPARTWRLAWLPLVWMLTLAALLYFNGAATPPPADSGSGVRADLLQLTDHLLQHARNAVTAHISPGAGAVLSLLAALTLALRSTRLNLARSTPASDAAVAVSALRG